jgi:chromosome segregation ATPase
MIDATQLVRELKKVPATKWGPLEGGRAEAARLADQSNGLYLRLERLRRDRPAAAATTAPKTSAVAKIDSEIQRLERELEVLKVAQRQCANDLLATLLENRAAWIDELREQEDEAVAAYRQTVERLIADRQAVTDARAMRSWLQNFDTSARFRPAVARLDSLRNPAGEGTAWTAVIAALRADLEAHEPKRSLHLAEPQGAAA